MHTESLPRLNERIGPELAEFGVWLRIGFVGAAVAAAGIAQAFEGQPNAFTTLGLIAGGIALTAGSWWRSKVLLARVDPLDTPAEAPRKALQAAVQRPELQDMGPAHRAAA